MTAIYSAESTKHLASLAIFLSPSVITTLKAAQGGRRMTMEVDDLFHLDRALTSAERRQLNVKLRSKKRGHIAPPGTGPEGETCGSCQHLYRNRLAKTYLKCELMRAKWTRGGGTDVRARDAACREWSALNADHHQPLGE